MASIVDHFDALARNGLKVIPLRQNSKSPVCIGWTTRWDQSEIRAKLCQFPESNLGLLLGDIIDVEGDTEEANARIIDLIGDYPHPSYTSTKSIHHLFLTPDPSLRHFEWRSIEFRGHGHQSVLPPSEHQGVKYRWLANFVFPVPPMPEKLVEFFHSKRTTTKNSVKPGHTRIACASCKKQVMLHEKRLQLELEAFRLLGSRWDCRKCRSLDLRPACRLIRSGVEKKIVVANTLRQF